MNLSVRFLLALSVVVVLQGSTAAAADPAVIPIAEPEAANACPPFEPKMPDADAILALLETPSDDAFWNQLVDSAPDHANAIAVLAIMSEEPSLMDLKHMEIGPDFYPSPEFVRAILAGGRDESLAQLNEPMPSNQWLSIEMRGLKLNEDRIDLTITTSIVTIDGYTTQRSEPLREATYRLTRTDREERSFRFPGLDEIRVSTYRLEGPGIALVAN